MLQCEADLKKKFPKKRILQTLLILRVCVFLRGTKELLEYVILTKLVQRIRDIVPVGVLKYVVVTFSYNHANR